jgi:hypothetical protein
MALDFLVNDKFVAVQSLSLLGPPTWTRLEPQAASGDPRPGIEARVHDPLWLIGRQWQLGEFQGEDAGTPLTVRVVTRTLAIDRWAPGDAGAARAFGRDRQDLLEPQVEREPVGPSGPGLRARAESAAALLAALVDAGLAAHRAIFVTQCPLDLDPLHHPDGANAALDPEWQRLVRLLGGRAMADGDRICQALEAAGDLPPWLVSADVGEHDALRAVLDPWRTWYRAEVSPPLGGDDAWIGERLEYRFRAGAGNHVFNAPAHGGGDIDWHSFDAGPSDALAEPDDAQAANPELREVHALLASPLRYPGMPADRLWEMEDARVNLGVVESEPWDLARLLVAEFALVYGNDWLVIPVDVPYGSLTTIESVLYTNTFGEHYVVRPTDEVSPDGQWRMFVVTTAEGESKDGLLIAPGAITVQDGPAIEEVLFVRDEMANLAWAIERSVQGPSGQARERSRERDDLRPPAPGPVERAQLDYLLQTALPARWIPYLPRTSGYRAIDLVQGRMPSALGAPIAPLGRILNTEAVKVLKDAEVPREGLVVRRRPSMTRRADGTYVRWTTRRVSIGRGEGSSQLAFDSAIPRRPRPNG